MAEERKFIGPWSGKLLTRSELAAECWDRVRPAESWGYRLERPWKRLRAGVWEPTARDLASRAYTIETGGFG